MLFVDIGIAFYRIIATTVMIELLPIERSAEGLAGLCLPGQSGWTPTSARAGARFNKKPLVRRFGQKPTGSRAGKGKL